MVIAETVASFIDTSLMTTIGQISATFIAITAGFYTTKIISIINDKSRLSGRIRELSTEESSVNNVLQSLQSKIDSIDKKESEEVVDLFIKGLIRDPLLPSYEINTTDDLISEFEKFIEQKPSSLHLTFLRSKALKVISEIQEIQSKISDSNTLPAYLPRRESDRIVDAISNQGDINRYNTIIDDRDSTSNKLSVIRELLKVVNNEYDTTKYPKHIKFGFISFIVFAVLGVIIPLTYGSWGTELLKAKSLWVLGNMNAIVLVLFGIGLTLNFIYIFRVARSNIPQRIILI